MLLVVTYNSIENSSTVAYVFSLSAVGTEADGSESSKSAWTTKQVLRRARL